MVRYRSVLALILVIVTTFLVSCSSPSAVKVPPTYSTAQIEQIQAYIPDMQALRDRMKEIPTLLQRREWIDIGNFVHGPLAELRYKMNYVTRKLLPEDQEKARDLTRDFFDQLVKIDQAAESGDARKVISNYQEALSDIDSFLNLLPQAVEDLETES
jgi:photosystem II protein PsbQ